MRKLSFALIFVFIIAAISGAFAVVDVHKQDCSPSISATAQPLAASDTVYITNTGTKFHKSTCRYLKKSKIAIKRSKAIEEGYTACKVCKP